MPTKAEITVKNPHKVPQRAWRRWNTQQRRTFNSVFSYMRDNQRMMIHPDARATKPDHWKTTAWNTAWLAADHVGDIMWGIDGTDLPFLDEVKKPNTSADGDFVARA